MGLYALRVLVSALLIVAITELGKRDTLLGSFVASLPVVSVLSFLWMHADAVPDERVAAMAQSIFWLVLASLVFFIVLAQALRSALGFWPSMLAAWGTATAAYLLVMALLRRVGTGC